MYQAIPRNLAYTTAAAVLLLLAGGWGAHRNLQTLAESNRWEQHARDVLRQLTLVLSTLQDAETGQRGYVLTGDPASRVPHDHAVRQVESATATLRNLVRDNPGQRLYLDRLDAMIAKRLRRIATTIELVADGRQPQALALVAEGGGARMMNDIRSLLGQMERSANGLLEARAQLADSARRRLQFTMFALIGMSLALVVMLFAASLRELRAAARTRLDILAANQQLERRVQERTVALRMVNEELESFAYSVSHDLRAPLRAVSGFAQILARRHRGNLDEEGRHYMDNVVAASGRMGVLIDDLLNYSRVGRTAIRSQPVPLAPLVQQVLGTLAKRIASSGALVEVVEPLATPLGDTTLVGQILANLLENALTYQQPGVAPRIRVAARQEGDATVIEIEDNGIGIADEYQKKVFEVFQRLHSDEQYPGTGIGLAIVRKAAQVMGGDVTVESLPSRGSTFRVRLPSIATGSPHDQYPSARPDPARRRQPHGHRADA